MKKNSIKFETSLIFVKDINQSKIFYNEILGQEISMDFGKCIAFNGGFSIMEKDYGHQIVFSKETNRVSNSNSNNNMELYFECEDIKRLYDTLKKNNFEFIHDVEEQPWGQFVFRFYDPDHFIIEIGEPIHIFISRMYKKGLGPEDIAKKSSVSIEIVRSIINKNYNN